MLAYAKVGWNELTRPLVAAEAEALRSFAARGEAPRTFRVARLLHADEWQRNTLTVVEPLVGGAPVSAPDPPRDATHELALGGAVTRARARPRATGGPDRGCASTRSAPTWAPPPTPIAAEAGDMLLRFGRGHGDWTPWNMRRLDGRLVVWDWERSRDGVPVGLDALHYGLLVALNARKLPPPRAVADTLERAPGLAARPRPAARGGAGDALPRAARDVAALRRGPAGRGDGAARPLRHRARASCSMYAGATRRYHESDRMSISISSLISLAPVFGVVVLAIISAFLLARGDDAARTRSGR